MKRIEVVIRPHALDQVHAALAAEGIARITVSGLTSWRRDTEPNTYRGVAYVPMSTRVRIEAVVVEDEVNRTLDLLKQVARAGRFEMDITIVPVARTIRIPAGGREPESVPHLGICGSRVA